MGTKFDENTRSFLKKANKLKMKIKARLLISYDGKVPDEKTVKERTVLLDQIAAIQKAVKLKKQAYFEKANDSLRAETSDFIQNIDKNLRVESMYRIKY